MMQIALLAQAARDRVTMQEVVERYGAERPNARGYMRCPFHAEKTPSMRIYQDGYHCFGCGAHGDAVDYVAQVMGLTARDALEMINRDFGLGLACGGRLTPFERTKAAREAQAHRDWRRALQMALDAAETVYLDALSEWLRLERNKDDYAPKAAGEAWHPLFVEALQQGAL